MHGVERAVVVVLVVAGQKRRLLPAETQRRDAEIWMAKESHHAAVDSGNMQGKPAPRSLARVGETALA